MATKLQEGSETGRTPPEAPGLMSPREDDKRLVRGPRFRWRRATAHLRMRPRFWILGAMKAGTSSLFDHLCQHPDVLRPYRKEAHFFTCGWRAGKSFLWYRAHFPTRAKAPAEAITGEATPDYLFEPEVPARIARFRRDARLIVVLRNPVDRAISHYWHERRMGRERLPLETAIYGEDARIAEACSQGEAGLETVLHASYRRRGEYASQLARLLEHFEREQLLVETSDDLFHDPESVTQRAFDFLGVPRPDRPVSFEAKNRAPAREDADPEVRAYLEDRLSPHNQALAEMLQRDLPW